MLRMKEEGKVEFLFYPKHVYMYSIFRRQLSYDRVNMAAATTEIYFPILPILNSYKRKYEMFTFYISHTTFIKKFSLRKKGKANS